MMGQILFFGLFLQSDTRDSRLPLRRFKSFNLSSSVESASQYCKTAICSLNNPFKAFPPKIGWSSSRIGLLSTPILCPPLS